LAKIGTPPRSVIRQPADDWLDPYLLFD